VAAAVAEEIPSEGSHLAKVDAGISGATSYAHKRVVFKRKCARGHNRLDFESVLPVSMSLARRWWSI